MGAAANIRPAYHDFGAISAYVRGEAFIGAQRYAEAAAEFQKILDHRGIVGLDPIGALAHLQLGTRRALNLTRRSRNQKGCISPILFEWSPNLHG